MWKKNLNQATDLLNWKLPCLLGSVENTKMMYILFARVTSPPCPFPPPPPVTYRRRGGGEREKGTDFCWKLYRTDRHSCDCVAVFYPFHFSRYRKEEASLESAAAAATDVTTAMMAVKIELEEKKRTNELLQRALVSSKKNRYRLTYFKHKALLVGVEVLRRPESC